MAGDSNKDVRGDSEIDRLAFQIYRDAVPRMLGGTNDEQIVIRCYQRAQAFLDTRDKIRSGALEVTKPIGPQLADVSCPNLPVTHPHNVVSKALGSLTEVAKILDWLEKHPAAEQYNEGRYSWQREEVHTARTIFPAYIQRPVAAA